jgi:competence protein ComEA
MIRPAVKRIGLGLTLLLSPIGAEASRKSPSTVSGVVNLNQATQEQLKMLSGMKESSALAIIAHREKHPFSRIEELAQIKGFSKKGFEKLKPHLSVNGPTTLKVEKAPHSVKGRKKSRKQ